LRKRLKRRRKTREREQREKHSRKLKGNAIEAKTAGLLAAERSRETDKYIGRQPLQQK